MQQPNRTLMKAIYILTSATRGGMSLEIVKSLLCGLTNRSELFVLFEDELDMEGKRSGMIYGAVAVCGVVAV